VLSRAAQAAALAVMAVIPGLLARTWRRTSRPGGGRVEQGFSAFARRYVIELREAALR
jgi:hypothetical protein